MWFVLCASVGEPRLGGGPARGRDEARKQTRREGSSRSVGPWLAPVMGLAVGGKAARPDAQQRAQGEGGGVAMWFNLRLKRSRHNRRKLSAKELWAERAAGLWSLSKSASVWALLLGLLGAMGWVGVHTWQTGLRLEWVRVKRVVVEGNQHVTQAEVEAALDYRAGEPFLPMLDPQTSERALERLPWVASARVRKEFPDTVKVKVEERQVAGLAYMGGLRLVDTRGVPFKALGRGESLDVPIVTGLGSDPGALSPEDHGRLREALLIARAYQEAGLERYDSNGEPVYDFGFWANECAKVVGVRQAA